MYVFKTTQTTNYSSFQSKLPLTATVENQVAGLAMERSVFLYSVRTPLSSSPTEIGGLRMGLGRWC